MDFKSTFCQLNDKQIRSTPKAEDERRRERIFLKEMRNLMRELDRALEAA